MADSQFARFLDVTAEAERQHIEFLKTEVRTGLTFLSVTRTELAAGNLPHAQRALTYAHKAYDVIIARLPAFESRLTERDRQWFEETLKDFGDALRGFTAKVKGA